MAGVGLAYLCLCNPLKQLRNLRYFRLPRLAFFAGRLETNPTMPLPKQEGWRYFAEKAANESDSEELLKHVSNLLQLLGNEQPGPTPHQVGWGGDSVTLYTRREIESGERTTEFLISAMAATSAKFGNIQVFDSASRNLKIVAQYGFGSEFLSHFAVVACEGASACSAVLEKRSRIVVENVVTDLIFRNDETRGVMLRANALSVQSTPLFGVSGDFLGVVSTHSDQPRTFSDSELQHLDDLVAEFILGRE